MRAAEESRQFKASFQVSLVKSSINIKSGFSDREHFLATQVRSIAACLILCLSGSAALAQTGDSDFTVNIMNRGPVIVHVPDGNDPSVPIPLIMALHPYGRDGSFILGYFKLLDLQQQYGFALVAPSGTQDSMGGHFWNATDVCCDFEDSGVDDSLYLKSLIDEIGMQIALDSDRIWSVGHSNGGAMSYRLACDYADLFAGVASLSGPGFLDPAVCNPSNLVHALHIACVGGEHTPYEGGEFLDDDPPAYPLAAGTVFPSAQATAEQWVANNGCSLLPALPPLPNVDIVKESKGPGLETSKVVYAACPTDGTVQFWTVDPGEHTPPLADDFNQTLLEYLFDHPRGCQFASLAAQEIVRVGSPPNPAALLPGLTSAPIVGMTWDPVIDHTTFMPAATHDALTFFVGPANIITPFGTLLCHTPLVTAVVLAGVPFSITPNLDCSIVGVSLCVQGGSWDGVNSQLTNALDITIGTF